MCVSVSVGDLDILDFTYRNIVRTGSKNKESIFVRINKTQSNDKRRPLST